METLLSEIKNAKQFFASRAETPGSTDGDRLMKKSFTEALLKQIGQVQSLEPSQASEIMDTLKNSPYSEHLSKLQTAIDGKVCAHQSKSGKSNAPQTLKHWWNYMTIEDWNFLKSKQWWSAKCTRLVERGNSLGVTIPDEQTFKYMLAVLLTSHYTEMPAAAEIYDKLQELKQVFSTETKPYPLEHLTEYPESPDNLPDEMYKHAYPNEKPSAVSCPGIVTVAEKYIPLRSSSKLLQGTKRDRDQKRAASPQVKTETPDKHWQILQASIKKEEVEPDSIVLGRKQSATDKEFERPHSSDHGDEYSVFKPKNIAEESLFCQYKADLWKLRAHTQGLLPMSSSSGKMQVKTEDDGSLVIASKLELSGEVKKEEDVHVKADPCKDEDVKAEEATDDELDPYAAAAVRALEDRNRKRKQQKDAERSSSAAVKKKPAKAGAAMEKEKVQVKKEKEKVQASTSSKRPKAPKTTSDGSNPDPVKYRQGVVYTCQSQQLFRCLKLAGDKWTEKRCSWKNQTKQEAFDVCLDAIDQYAKANKKGK